MMSEEDVRAALLGWRAGEAVALEHPEVYTPFEQGRAQGYRMALEMVLRGASA